MSGCTIMLLAAWCALPWRIRHDRRIGILIAGVLGPVSMRPTRVRACALYS